MDLNELIDKIKDPDAVILLLEWLQQNRDKFRGPPGRDGLSIYGDDGISVNNAKVLNGQLFVYLSDGRKINAGSVIGPKGNDGESIVGPAGPSGKDGADGVGIAAIEQPNPDTAKVVLTDGREYDLNLPRGRDGKDGQAITINKRGGSGSNTDAPQTAVGGFVPTLIKADQTFTIPEDTQALFMKRIKLENGARLKAFGVLVQPR